jgi:predicted AAA+ superfamily ATPase
VNPKGKIFVFIDEVQEAEGWENVLKRIYDLEKNIKVFISGSNFSLSKQDFASKLAGRFAYFELYPFSFREFLDANGIKTESKIYLASKKHEIKHYFLQYAELGGFPEVALEPDDKKKTQLLQFYFDTIVYRDIIKRRRVRSSDKLEKLVNYFLQNISNQSNFFKIGKEIYLSTDSVSEYVKYLQDAFFIFSVPLFSFSVKKQEINPKKIYCVDTGLRNVKGFRFSEDYGRLAENMVFVEIRRRGFASPLSKIFYWKKEGKEVDFIVMEGLKTKELIQVCWDIENKETRKREISGLLGAMNEFQLSKGLILTEDFEGRERVGRKVIIYQPLWKWLLDF